MAQLIFPVLPSATQAVHLIVPSKPDGRDSFIDVSGSQTSIAPRDILQRFDGSSRAIEIDKTYWWAIPAQSGRRLEGFPFTWNLLDDNR